MNDREILEILINEASKATCSRAKGGSIIIKNNAVVARGSNSPPNNLEKQRRCSRDKR